MIREPSSDLIADCLTLAAREVEVNGLHQGSNIGPDGSVCVGEAMNRVAPTTEHIFFIREALCRSLGIPVLSETSWNDALERTTEDAVLALCLAAARTRPMPFFVSA